MKPQFPTIGFLLGTLAIALMNSTPARGVEAHHDIRDFGARGEGVTLCTAAIQKAIDACAADGGGTVYCGPGAWLTGTITLKSHVSLYLDNGSTLCGSTNLADYPPWHPRLRSYTDNYVEQSLIAGEDLEQVGIFGRGTIDGNGQAFQVKGGATRFGRPYVIRLVNCTNVMVEGIALRNSPMCMQHYLGCRQLVLRGLRVYNHATKNNDGITVDSCCGVVVSDCMLDTDDDALCFKSTTVRPCENVAVNNCIITTHCEAIKLGTESPGGFKNITINNCVISAPPANSHYLDGFPRGISGIALETVDGGQSENINLSNITMRDVPVPIFIRLGNRARPISEGDPKPGIGVLRRLTLSNIAATGASRYGCSITGLPGNCVEDVLLSNVQLSFVGGDQPPATSADPFFSAIDGKDHYPDNSVPDLPTNYPAGCMFNVLPSYGFYCHHVRGLELDNVSLKTDAPDQRSAVICDDVNTLALAGVEARSGEKTAPVILLRDVSEAIVRGCQLGNGKFVPVRLEGSATHSIEAGANSFSRQQIERGKDVPAAAISLPAGGR